MKTNPEKLGREKGETRQSKKKIKNDRLEFNKTWIRKTRRKQETEKEQEKKDEDNKEEMGEEDEEAKQNRVQYMFKGSDTLAGVHPNPQVPLTRAPWFVESYSL